MVVGRRAGDVRGEMSYKWSKQSISNGNCWENGREVGNNLANDFFQ